MSESFSPDPAKSVSVAEIVNGTRCSPLTLKEFEEFLIHEEHSEENLLFVVWYRDYCARFAALSPELQALSEAPDPYRPFYNQGSISRAGSMRSPSVMEKDRSWWEKVTSSKNNRNSTMGDGKKGAMTAEGGEYFDAEDRSQFGGSGDEEAGEGVMSVGGDSTVSFRTAAAEFLAEDRPDTFPMTAGKTSTSAFPTSASAPVNSSRRGSLPLPRSDSSITNSDAPPKKNFRLPALRFAGLAPTTSRTANALPADTPLPFVDEIALVLSTFILPGGSRELNLDAKLKKYILNSLQPVDENGKALPVVTTHPDIFKAASDHAFDLMEGSLPKYLNFAKGNINTPKVLFWYAVGFTDVMIGVMIALVIMFQVRVRWWRIFSCIFIDFGVMQAYSASRYFCSQVHGRNSRQLYPWELTSTMSEAEHERPTATPFNTVALSEKDKETLNRSPNLSAASTGEFAIDIPVRKAPQQKRSRWWGAWKKDNGERVAVFGPERVIEDEYIKHVHNQQIKEILIVGLIVTILFEIMIVAIPEQV